MDSPSTNKDLTNCSRVRNFSGCVWATNCNVKLTTAALQNQTHAATWHQNAWHTHARWRKLGTNSDQNSPSCRVRYPIQNRARENHSPMGEQKGKTVQNFHFAAMNFLQTKDTGTFGQVLNITTLTGATHRIRDTEPPTVPWNETQTSAPKSKGVKLPLGLSKTLHPMSCDAIVKSSHYYLFIYLKEVHRWFMPSQTRHDFGDDIEV